MISELKMTSREIGVAVRARRRILGMNQSELAMVSGTGVRFISDLENGKPMGLEIQITTHKRA